jgi:hypothetical protein
MRATELSGGLLGPPAAALGFTGARPRWKSLVDRRRLGAHLLVRHSGQLLEVSPGFMRSLKVTSLPPRVTKYRMFRTRCPCVLGSSMCHSSTSANARNCRRNGNGGPAGAGSAGAGPGSFGGAGEIPPGDVGSFPISRQRGQLALIPGAAVVISDRDVWAAALLMVKRYGDDAMLEASEAPISCSREGDMAGAETWHRILNAIERLQAKAPTDGENVH